MTNTERKQALERIVVLKYRNSEIEHLISTGEELDSCMKDILHDILSENSSLIEQLAKVTGTRYEFLFNFEGGGWNSEWAHTKEEAQDLARGKYSSEVDFKSFRVSTLRYLTHILPLTELNTKI